MADSRICTECGAELPSGSPHGICPRCLLRAGPGQSVSPDASLAAHPESTMKVLMELATEKPGDRIGRYKLLQKLGEGGCGTVYMAEQGEPVKRRVALKVIKLGMDTKEVIARFEAERQALALMDHPNIARVLDGGATSVGRPFFVMELVRGIPITRFCDENRLDTQQRLQLFVQVCHAIQHAHQKGIIHRDIKPSNILVADHDGTPVPKVIDFGIAKATAGQTLTDKTVFTAFEQFVGTPAYMSPEQAKLSGLDIDTRSDIYSLGVLLYELLTGKTPFDSKRLLAAGLDEIRRIIREEDPPRPSTRLSTLDATEQADVARQRQTELPKLAGLVRGDLDWIVMKTLEKDRSRRYETANAIAADLKRFVSHEPVLARPPSSIYRFQKLVRRHRVAFAATSAVALALVLGFGLSTWLFIQERAARKDAKTEAVKSHQVAQFLKDMLASVGPSKALGRDTTMLREVLEKTAMRLSKDLQNQRDVQAELQDTIGTVYLAIGEYQKAEAMQRAALDLRKQLFGNENLAVATSLNDLAAVLAKEGVLEEAEMLDRTALAVRRKLLGENHPDVAMSLNNLANILRARSKLAEAEVLHRQALALRKKLFGPQHPEVANSLANLATVLWVQGKLSEAESMYRDALTMKQRLSGDSDPNLCAWLNNLALVLWNEGKLAEAEATFREALAMLEKLLGSEHPDLAAPLNNLTLVLWSQNKISEAEVTCRRALRILQKPPTNDHPYLAQALSNLGLLLGEQGNWHEAESMHREALAMRRRLFVGDHTDIAWSLYLLGIVLNDQGKLTEAEATHREALAMRIRLLGNEHIDVANSLCDLATVLQAQHRLQEAETMQRQALALYKESFGDDQHQEMARSLNKLALVLADQGRRQEAETLLREALRARRKLLGDEDPSVAESLGDLAGVLRDDGKLDEAETLARQCLALRQHRPDDWRASSALCLLGGILVLQKQYASAEPMLLSGYSGLKQQQERIPAEGWPRLKQTAEDLVQLYQARGQIQDAADWKTKLAELEPATTAQAVSTPKQ